MVVCFGHGRDGIFDALSVVLKSLGRVKTLTELEESLMNVEVPFLYNKDTK